MNILIPCDGSTPALHAVKYAAQLLTSLQAGAHHITLLSVHEDAGLRHAKSMVGQEAVTEFLRAQGEKDLKAARKLLSSRGIAYEEALCTGHVAQQIVAFAQRGKFDLIVMGSKGRSGIADLLLGSVAQRVLASAKQPVLLVK